MSERNPWDRMIEEGESAKWFSRFSRFRMMKPWERSVNAVFEAEETEKHGKARTKIPGRWYKFSKQWKWEERAAAWDKSQLDERDKQIAAEEADRFRRGLALRTERINELEEKAHLIEQSWHDDKQEKVIFQWLTPEKVREWRGCLDDIAKIKGEHKIRQEITGKNGGPIEHRDSTQHLTDEDLQMIIDGAIQAKVKANDNPD